MVRVLHNDFIGCPAPDTAQGKAVHRVGDARVDLQLGQCGLDAKDELAHIHKGPCGRAGQPAVFRLAEGRGIAASHHRRTVCQNDFVNINIALRFSSTEIS